ncbi:hypothetical protein [Paenibacillus tyrfis]|uniref:Uncharacterized protein n=1 Tax=Paenibacillus tyrfis TaxID=1501230 RepID=A0A081NYA2_9BACL|nr:hypothetical protein [Paenibacillus tyrfis]KEQ23425.1 hypothetical protein ET33_16490 [Paenibacillus tyrfis]
MSDEKSQPAETSPKSTAERKPIEYWRDALNTGQAVYVGLLATSGWAEGYECTQKEYEKAVEAFLKKPIPPTRKGR